HRGDVAEVVVGRVRVEVARGHQRLGVDPLRAVDERPFVVRAAVFVDGVGEALDVVEARSTAVLEHELEPEFQFACAAFDLAPAARAGGNRRCAQRFMTPRWNCSRPPATARRTSWPFSSRRRTLRYSSTTAITSCSRMMTSFSSAT